MNARRLRREARAVACLAAALSLVLFAPSAFAEKVIWQYDDLPGEMTTLADGLKKHPVSAHPGFVKGEAFGQIYKPKASDYPVKILSVELVMAAAEKATAPFPEVPIAIEIYNDQAINAAPDGAPVFTINSADFFNAAAGKPGMNVVGNTGMIFEFDWTKPENHPPEITSGNIRVVIRVLSDAGDTGEYWEPGCSTSGLGLCQCAKQDFGMGLELCGCQQLAAISDSATTAKANVLHIVYPVGTCSGTKKWVWLEDVAKEGKQMKGDFVLRIGVDGVAGGVVDPDAGSQADTSDQADVPELDTAPAAKPVVLFVSPAAIEEGKLDELEVVGENFLAGAKVSIGAVELPVASVTASKITATIKPTLTPGVYPVVVENPNGQVGYKDAAFTVTAKLAPDVSEDAAPVDANDGAALDPGPLTLDLVKPDCVSATLDTQVTIFGTGFVDGMTFELGGQALIAVNVETASKATALAPKGMALGPASLVATRNGKSASLANAVQVGCSAPAAPRDAGCSASPSAPSSAGSSAGSSSLVGLLVAALAAMLRTWRRRTMA